MAHLDPRDIQRMYDEYGDLKVLDDIIRHRAADNPPVPILGYPRTPRSLQDYEYFTGRQLDRFVDAAARKFVSAGLEPSSQGANDVVALLGPSDLSYVVSVFALSRLGYTVMFLSLRIEPDAIMNLLNQTGCLKLAYHSTEGIEKKLRSVKSKFRLHTVCIPSRIDYDRGMLEVGPKLVRTFDRVQQNGKAAIIMHSSGSTGLPKPVSVPHKALLVHAIVGRGLHNFNPLPLYHMYGLSTMLQAMYKRRKANLYSASLPITTDNLIIAIETVRPEIFHVVPYTLGLMAEQQRGIAYMRAAKLVLSGGAHTPDDLGDRLTKEGVRVGVSFGCTEAGLIGESADRPADDPSWNYIRFFPNIRDHLHFEQVGEGEYELIFLKSHPALSASNSDYPAPGSFRSRDVFAPHPTIPDAWKYITRLDDRITLLNGEKVLPLPIEGTIREDKNIREAVVVGIDRPVPGLLVFRAEALDHLSDDAYLEIVWPSIQEANSSAEAFSKIAKDMVQLVPSGVPCPKADKGSIIRAKVYKQFAQEIENLYQKSQAKGDGPKLRLGLHQIEKFLDTTFKDIMGFPLESPETDFYAAGMDSLKAIQMKRAIEKTLELGGGVLGANIVYECRTPRGLAQHLHRLAEGDQEEEDDGMDLISQMIFKYSKFGEVAVLTGATGSIGAHVLAKLTESKIFRKVYCLVRGPKPMARVLDSLKERGLRLPASSKSKIVALTSDLSQSDLGLGEDVLEEIRHELSLILHIAWPVNFNLPLKSFEPQFAGLQNLIGLSMSVPKPEPAQLMFCSSVSTAHNVQGPAMIPEGPITDFSHADPMGYAQSKLVGEHMIMNAVRSGARASVLRIGQVVGDKNGGLWNDKEMIPAVIRSALSTKTLPELKGEHCSWLPADTLATAMVQLYDALSQASERGEKPPVFYNMVNPHTFSWSEMLEGLRATGLTFETIPFGGWLEKLQDSAQRGEEEKNPAIKLMDYLSEQWGPAKEQGEVLFETGVAQTYIPILRQPPRILDEGYLNKFMTRWLQRWT